MDKVLEHLRRFVAAGVVAAGSVSASTIAGSIPLKAGLAVSNNLAGISVWGLGLDKASFRQAVQAGGL